MTLSGTMNCEKQTAGFKFGKHRVMVLEEIHTWSGFGKTYALLNVETSDGNLYVALRVYNSKHHFLKQVLVEPVLAQQIFKMKA
jgi:hypothetical protein